MPKQEQKTHPIECRFNEAENTIDLYVYDLIVYPPKWEDSETTSGDVVSQLSARPDVNTINVYINSAGGAVFEAFAIYNVLTRHKATVNVFIDGLAASAASLLAMAGDTITMAENALLMVHEPSSGVWGNAAEMQKEIVLLGKISETLVSTYVARSGQSAEVVSGWVTAETWFTAAEALENKLVDSVSPAKRVAASLDVSRFKNLPSSFAGRAQPTGHKPPADQKESDMPPLAAVATLASVLASLEADHAVIVTDAIDAAKPGPPVAATHSQIKGICPGCEAGFIVDQLEAEATGPAAVTAYLNTLVAKVENRDAKIVELSGEVTAANAKIADIVAGVGGEGAPDPLDGVAGKGKGFASLVRMPGHAASQN